MSEALDTIRIEHANYDRVLECLRRLLERLDEATAVGRGELLFLILDCLESFPATFHHPKEDGYLFTALRRRRPECGPLLEQLQAEHAAALELVRDFRLACEAYRTDRTAFGRVRAVGTLYLEFEQAHMEREEREVLPRALEALSGEDWRAIDLAFAGHHDPLFGTARAKQFDKLFDRILHLTGEALGPRPGADPDSRVRAAI